MNPHFVDSWWGPQKLSDLAEVHSRTVSNQNLGLPVPSWSSVTETLKRSSSLVSSVTGSLRQPVSLVSRGFRTTLPPRGPHHVDPYKFPCPLSCGAHVSRNSNVTLRVDLKISWSSQVEDRVLARNSKPRPIPHLPGCPARPLAGMWVDPGVSGEQWPGQPSMPAGSPRWHCAWDEAKKSPPSQNHRESSQSDCTNFVPMKIFLELFFRIFLELFYFRIIYFYRIYFRIISVLLMQDTEPVWVHTVYW